MDDYSQATPDYDHPQAGPGADGRRRLRGSRGDRAGQFRRWAARNRTRRRLYMRAYMAHRRAAGKGRAGGEGP